jgi:hypothetical protein
MAVYEYMIDLKREIFKPVLKLDFTAHVNEVSLRIWTLNSVGAPT